MAWRYWAMRGESLEPGGCSATPTSACAAASAARPAAVPPVPAVPRVAVEASGDPVALVSASTKVVGCAVVDATVGVAAGVSRVCSSAMRSRALTRDTRTGIGRERIAA